MVSSDFSSHHIIETGNALYRSVNLFIVHRYKNLAWKLIKGSAKLLNKIMPNEYLRTDHWIDAVASLEATQKFCACVTLDEHQWKWVMIATHSAVQGFMALALDQGNGLLVLKDDIAAKWLKAHASDKRYPEEKMDFFLSLYEKVKSDVVCCYSGSKKFISESSHDYSMKKLNELRNDYIHFRPKGWSIELAGLPSVALNCLEVAKFLAFDSFTIIWHDGDLRNRAERAFAVVQAELIALESIYKAGVDEESYQGR